MPSFFHTPRSLRFITCLFLIFFCACAPKNFSIMFSLPQDTDTTVRMLYYAADKRGGRYLEVVAAIQAGKGSLECPAVLPTLVYVMASSGTPVMTFYAERGDKIEISGDNADPLGWRVKGNRLSEEWSDWRLENLTVLRSADPVRINEAVKTYVSSNPDSRLSTLLLLTSYDRKRNPAGYEALWKSLGKKALDPELIALASRADQRDETAPQTGKLKQFTLRTLSGLDTVTPDHPAIFYFWHASQSGMPEAIAMLKRLIAERKDSATLLVADICLDPDSVTWRVSLQSDSLRHSLRGWLPAGETDSTAMGLGVSRTPLFIITDKKGKVVFKGDSPSEAEAEVRKRF